MVPKFPRFRMLWYTPESLRYPREMSPNGKFPQFFFCCLEGVQEFIVGSVAVLLEFYVH